MYGNYSTSKDWRRSDPNIRPSSVAMSYSQSPTSPSKTNGSTEDFKLSRRPVPVGKSVAALQQQHQWLMQKSNEGPSPSGSVRSVQSSVRSSHSNASLQSNGNGVPDRSSSPLILQRFATGAHQQQQQNESDDEQNSDEQQPQQKQLLDETGTIRSTSDQMSILSSASTIKSPQAPPRRRLSTGGSSQEGRVAHEGWVYRKNSLMQWKQVYAVAKHGNSIKPGGLYLYKDDKFSSHIQTFDMSEVVEVEPRAQEYRAGIKWEFRILVKRDDVIIATDDIATRKVWIDALTSIMGKVSIASHSELQSRVVSADQVNRELQSAVDGLQSENEHLREQLNAIQKEVQRRQGEHSVREKELEHDLDDIQQAMDTRCELLEGELSVWRSKANGLEKELQQTKKHHQEKIKEQQKVYQEAVAQHKMEVAEWRARVDVLEKQGKQQQQTYYDYHNLATANNISSSSNKRRPSTRSSKSNHYNKRRHHHRRRDDYTSSSSDEEEEDDDQQQSSSIKETIADVRYNLQALGEQLKNESGPLVQSHIVDIKAGVTKLNDTLDEARKGWTDLQVDIMQFFEENTKDTEKGQDGSLKELNAQVNALRQELNGDEEGQSDEGEDGNKKITFGGKFDVMMQMVEMVQLSQNRLMSCYLEQAEDENKGIHIDKARMEAVQTMLEELQERLLANNQQQQFNTMSQQQLEGKRNSQEQLQKAIVTQLQSIMQNQQDQQATEIISKFDEYMALQQQSIIDTIQKNTNEIHTQDREEHEKNLKVLGQLLQHVISQIEASSIPDLPALSEQLEQTVDRLSIMADRLSKKTTASSSFNNTVATSHGGHQQDMDHEDEHGNNVSLQNGAAIGGDDHTQDQQTLQEIQELIDNTQSFMKRTLIVLERYDNQAVEETVRRAVKSAFNTYFDVHWEQQKKSDDKDEKLMKRYEENARSHFDKSMSNMRGHLEEYTGVLYRMIEDLVLRAVEHLDQGGNVNSNNNNNVSTSDGNGVNADPKDNQRTQKTDYLIELHTKLSTTKDRLETEIERLQEEQQSLEAQVGGLKKTRKDLEKELEEKRMSLHAVKVEHETLLQNNLIQPATAALARELEPLVHQITRLKQLASFQQGSEDDASQSSSSGGYVDLGHLSQQQQQQQQQASQQTYHQPQYTNKTPSPPEHSNDYRGAATTTSALHAPRKFMNERRSSFDNSSSTSVGTGWKTSSTSSSQQQQTSTSSSSHVLNGGRTRATSPLGVFLGRKS
ncbi:hypothetical protein BDA99DRAFT_497688 [Phascolomyces articulosus]|uniref:PH domain-containing protein n=1 Tax=Phascolomyces articulosus TaxID=60185 RepID=A0AAD5KRM4_9FUNG|nr:hypothetical protein BDA99DRAFT_497688 [Phascolomyces articulosus]